MNLDDARAKFVAEHATYERTACWAAETISKATSAAGIRCEVSARAKEVASFVKKGMTKGYEDPWAEITDKVGVRVTVGVASEVDRVVELLGTLSDVVVLRVEDKRHPDPQVLDYLGVHVQVEVRADEGEAIEVEVQVRTTAQDLWSVASHTLLYKPTVSLSRDWQRRLWRLLALVEIFDEEVQSAMNELLTSPLHEVHQLVLQAEAVFLTFAAAEFDLGLSLDVCEVLLEAIPQDERATYDEKLKEFAVVSRLKLERLYADYGPGSTVAAEGHYILLSQPESLVLLERVTAAPEALRTVVDGRISEQLLEPVLGAWGAEFR